MDKNGVKYLQGTNFLQATLTENAGIKNLVMQQLTPYFSALIKQNTNLCEKLDVCLSVQHCICVEKKNQLDATEWVVQHPSSCMHA